MNAEKMVIAEAQRTFTYLCMFQYRVDAVVVNRLIPDDVSDPYFQRWKDVQAEHMSTIRSAFAPVPILEARLFDREMIGPDLLSQLASEVYEELDPGAVLHTEETMRITRDGSEHKLWIRVPFATKGEIELSRRDDELFLKVGSMKRSVILPQMLRKGEVADARLDEEWLVVGFRSPDRDGRVVPAGAAGLVEERA